MTELFQKLIPQGFLHSEKVLSDEEYEQARCDQYNATAGRNENENALFDVYDCTECKNKMKIAFVDEYGDFSVRACKCMIKRKALYHIKKSGLTGELRRKTFDTYITSETWQERAKETAQEYLQYGKDHWLYAGGQTGCGKTHLCTAVCNKFLNKGISVRYILWRELTRKLSANRFNQSYDEIISDIMKYDAIYIDDFLKSAKPQNELDFAFELINSMYTRRKRVIISSELLLEDINQLDGAVAGRIREMASGYILQISKDDNKNYRMRA